VLSSILRAQIGPQLREQHSPEALIPLPALIKARLRSLKSKSEQMAMQTGQSWKNRWTPRGNAEHVDRSS